MLTSKLERFFFWTVALLAGSSFILWQVYQPLPKNTDINISRAAFLVTLTASIIFIMLYRSVSTAEKRGLKELTDTQAFISMLAILSLGLLFRFLMSKAYTGFPNDIIAWKTWAQKIAEDLPGFYNNNDFKDYPPGYMYILFLVGMAAKALKLQFESSAFTALVKLPAMIADIGMAYFIYRLAGAKDAFGSNYRFRLFAAALVVFNPVIFFISTIWGQVDIILSLAVVAAIYFLYRRKFVLSSVMYAVAILIKPQGIIFLPVLGFALLRDVFVPDPDNPHPVKKIFVSAASAIGVFIAGILPFSFGMPWYWIFAQYGSAVGGYTYSSINAFNLFTLLDQNWEQDSAVFFLFSNFVWGLVFIALVVLLVGYMYLKAKDPKPLPILGAIILITGVFNLYIRMHDRYAFPAILLLLMAYIFIKDIKYLLLFAFFTITQAVNYYHVFIVYLGTPYKNFLELPSVMLGSFVNLAVFALIVYTAFGTIMKPPVALTETMPERRRPR